MLLSPLPSRASLSLFLLVILSAAKNPRILPLLLLLLLLSPLLFLLSSPKGICFCLYSLRQPQQKRVRPILRTLREGWNVTSPPARFSFFPPRPVISTEAVHIVNGGAEKSASPPRSLTSHAPKPSNHPQKPHDSPRSIHVFPVKKSHFQLPTSRRIHPKTEATAK